MRRTYLTMLFLTLLGFTGLKAQVTTSPSPLQEDSENITIYFHADQGSKGLMGLDANTNIYAHTGVLTNASTNDSDWKYTVADWEENIEKAQMVYEGPNLWSLYIGNIREYYGITDMSVEIKDLMFVFRTANGSKEGKTANGSDIKVEVFNPGLQIQILPSVESYFVDASTGPVTFDVTTTQNATISLAINGNVVATEENTTSLEYSYTFPGIGDYEVEATAVADGEMVTATLNFAYLDTPQAQDYPGGIPIMGPVANPDGSVTFCMAAPEMSRMVLIGSWNGYEISNEQQMYYQDYLTTNPVTGESGTFRYFWITIPDLADGEQYVYYFHVEGTFPIAGGTETVSEYTYDPYARLVLDPWNDKYIDTNVFPNLPAYPYGYVNDTPVGVYQSTINDYNWVAPSIELPDKDNLIIYEMLFRDFTGTEGKALGNGTVRGAIEKLDYLIELGVNVIEVLPIYEFEGNLSWGYNPNVYFAPDKAYGTPDDYKEFIDLCHQNGIAVVLDMVFNQSNGLHPWCRMYGGAANSPFYNGTSPHDYSVLDDWNQGYPLVQVQWKDVLTYWLTEYNFDGFRFDLVKGLGLNDSYGSGTEAYNQSRVNEMKYLNSIIQEVKPGAYCINENLASAQEENEMAADGEINWYSGCNNPACEFAMGYPASSNLNNLYAPKSGRTWGSTISYLESHDEQRLAYKQDQWGVPEIKGKPLPSMQRLGSAAAQMIMTPGSHMIWQFSEMGNAQNTKKDDGGNNTDNKIVNWNLLKDPFHYYLYHNYCALIDFRFNNPQFFTQEADFTINCSNLNWANGRSLISKINGQEVVTVVNPNFSGEPLVFNYNFEVPDNNAYQIYVKSEYSNPSFDAVNGTITVPINCFVVIGSADLTPTGIESIEADTTNGPTLRVAGGYGEIIISDASEAAEIYTLDGKKVGIIANSGRISTQKGIYVVRSGNDTVKVIVR